MIALLEAKRAGGDVMPEIPAGLGDGPAIGALAFDQAKVRGAVQP